MREDTNNPKTNQLGSSATQEKLNIDTILYL